MKAPYIRICCVCRREIAGDLKSAKAFGPVLARCDAESTGFCYPCFVKAYGELDAPLNVPERHTSPSPV